MINSDKIQKDCLNDSFSKFLFDSRDNVFTVDLSNASLLEAFEQMISVKSRIYPTYYKHFRTVIKYISMIQFRYGCVVYPHQINDVFWSYFVPFLENEGLAFSTIKHTCICIKTLIAWAVRYGAKISPSYNIVTIPEYKNQQISLTPDEVSRIYHFDLSTIKRRSQCLRRFERVRDMFVLSCNLGQRYSDMIRINRSCFDDYNIFRIMQQKTGNKARVDINKMSIDRKTTLELLKKYDYNPPTTVDLSGFAKTLHELMRYIGFDEMVKRESRVGGFVKEEFIPKWKLITSHTARRTFITVNVMRGFNIMEIRRASGHASQSTFERYLCYTDDY